MFGRLVYGILGLDRIRHLYSDFQLLELHNYFGLDDFAHTRSSDFHDSDGLLSSCKRSSWLVHRLRES